MAHPAGKSKIYAALDADTGEPLASEVAAFLNG